MITEIHDYADMIDDYEDRLHNHANTFDVFTDGGCRPNPGVGGWGFHYFDGTKHIEKFGGQHDTTNNQMELLAAINALKSLPDQSSVRLHSDSDYVITGISKWIMSWKKKNWKLANKHPIKNIDLWQQLDAIQAKHSVEWVWVKGHAGHPGNVRADELATIGLMTVEPI